MQEILKMIRDKVEDKNPTEVKINEFNRVKKAFQDVGINVQGYVMKQENILPEVKCKWCENLKHLQKYQTVSKRISASEYVNKKILVDIYQCTVYNEPIIDFNSLGYCEKIKLKR